MQLNVTVCVLEREEKDCERARGRGRELVGRWGHSYKHLCCVFWRVCMCVCVCAWEV